VRVSGMATPTAGAAAFIFIDVALEAPGIEMPEEYPRFPQRTSGEAHRLLA